MITTIEQPIITPPAPALYIPPIATSELSTYSNKIVGIQGEPGTGKTVSSLTFPNPIIALFEKPDLKEMLQLPLIAEVKPHMLHFYSSQWVNEVCKFPKSGKQTDNAGCFKSWLEKEGPKLTQDQTLVLDNWTRNQEHFDRVNWSEPMYPTYSKDGSINDFAPWDVKITYAEEVHDLFHNLRCNVVVLFHELRERDKKTGEILEKLQPLMQGKFQLKLKSYYPYFFRQLVRKPRDKAGEIIKGAPVEYVWQTRGDDYFSAKCAKVNLPPFVPANYSSIA